MKHGVVKLFFRHLARDDELLQSGQPAFDEREVSTPTGVRRTIASRRLIIHDPDGRSKYLLGVVEDITEQKQAAARIAHLAHYDALTDLPNRVLLRERLEHELTYAGRGAQLAVLYLDLDHFKGINDTLGHSPGDTLLKAVAGQLRSCLRPSDTIARLGGDEFAIVQAPLDHPTDAATLAQRFHNCDIVTMQGAGHLPYEELPDQFNAAVIQFLRTEN